MKIIGEVNTGELLVQMSRAEHDAIMGGARARQIVQALRRAVADIEEHWPVAAAEAGT